MEAQPSKQYDDKLLAQVQGCASLLVEKLQSENYDDACQIILDLVESRDKHLFNSIGKLTRGLHNAILNFHVEVDFSSTPPEVSHSEIRDASDRLNYVLDLTQKAANQTMDKVEAVAPMAAALGDEARRLREEWTKLKRREISKVEFKELYNRMGDFLDHMEVGVTRLSGSLQEIVLEQGYQDLSGQVLKKVISLVTDVENELVELMRIASEVGQATGLENENRGSVSVSSIEAEGPQIHADKRADVVSGQDEVDDLLSSLGF